MAVEAAILEAATIAVLPERIADAAPLTPERLVGAGPYRVAEVADDERIVLAAFERFPGGKPSIETIEFRIVPDGLMRAMELVHGSIDMVQNALDPDTTEWIASEGRGLLVHRGPSDSFQYLGMNLEHAALGDRRVRRAIAHALDRLRSS